MNYDLSSYFPFYLSLPPLKREKGQFNSWQIVRYMYIDKFNLIEQKGMTFGQDFCHSILLFSSLLFLEGRRTGEKNNQRCGQCQCGHVFLLNRSILTNTIFIHPIRCFFCDQSSLCKPYISTYSTLNSDLK